MGDDYVIEKFKEPADSIPGEVTKFITGDYVERVGRIRKE